MTSHKAVFENYYRAEHWRDGQLLAIYEMRNLIPDEGVNRILEKYYTPGLGYTSDFFVGLKAAGTTAAADRMSSHAGWQEIVSYYESARPQLQLGSVVEKSLDNSANVAVFSISANCQIAGAFITTSDVKNGSVGTLSGVGDFPTGTISALAGDVVNVTVTLTGASA